MLWCQEQDGRRGKGRAAGSVDQDVLLMVCLQNGCQYADKGQDWLLSLVLGCKNGWWHVVMVRWAGVDTWELKIGLTNIF